MARMTAEQAADKLIRNLGNSVQDIERGVDNVTVSPTQKAAAASKKWLMNTQAAEQKYINGLKSVSLEDWKKAFKEKGINRIASGIQASRPKLVAFYTKFLPFLDTVSSAVNAMPNNTLQDSIARMTKAVTMIHDYGRTSK